MFQCFRAERSEFESVESNKRRKTNHLNLIYASPRRIVGGVGRRDRRTARNPVVRVHSCTGYVPRVLSYGVLNREAVSVGIDSNDNIGERADSYTGASVEEIYCGIGNVHEAIVGP